MTRTYELHATVKQVGRSSGRSSVAAAAYRSASLLHDERTGLTHDYTHKQGVEFSRIYAPTHAPQWVHDRAKLWNAVEAVEKKLNATTAHELELAFPAEFNMMQRREAGDVMSRELLSRYNCVVDISYHEPHRDGDARNYHAHILFTTRGLDETRENGWARTKYRDLSKDYAKDEDGKFIMVDGKKVTRGSLEISDLRKFAANEMNRIAQRDGLAVHTEHLSFEARGIDKEATQHLGYQANDMERQGKRSRRGDVNREIKASNDNRDQLKEEAKVISLAHEREKRQLLQEIKQAQVQAADSVRAAAQARREELVTKHAKQESKRREQYKIDEKIAASREKWQIDELTREQTRAKAAYDKINTKFGRIFRRKKIAQAHDHWQDMSKRLEERRGRWQADIDAFNKERSKPAQSHKQEISGRARKYSPDDLRDEFNKIRKEQEENRRANDNEPNHRKGPKRGLER